jgi:hypothetical protein
MSRQPRLLREIRPVRQQGTAGPAIGDRYVDQEEDADREAGADAGIGGLHGAFPTIWVWLTVRHGLSGVRDVVSRWTAAASVP